MALDSKALEPLFPTSLPFTSPCMQNLVVLGKYYQIAFGKAFVFATLCYIIYI